MSSRAKYRLVVRRVLARLRPLGFRVSGNTACRDTNGNWELVFVEAAGKWQTGEDEVRFAVFVGVRLASTRRILGYMGADERPKDRITDIWASLGEQLLPGAKVCDTFVINASSVIEQFEEQLYRDIVKYGIPWLNEHGSPSGLAAVLADALNEECPSRATLLTLAVLYWTLDDHVKYNAVKTKLTSDPHYGQALVQNTMDSIERLR